MLGLIAGLKRFAPKVPVALTTCMVALVVSLAFDLEHRGIEVVGRFPAGLPGFAWPMTEWRDVHLLLPAAIGIALHVAYLFLYMGMHASTFWYYVPEFVMLCFARGGIYTVEPGRTGAESPLICMVPSPAII